jgi:hypothetical protein
MGAARRFLAMTASVMLLGALSSGPASAAPIDFVRGQKYDAVCDGTLLSAEPVIGDGAFTPYWIYGKDRRLLVPVSLLLTGDLGLKARHLTPGTPITKPGLVPTTGLTTCVITGEVRQPDGVKQFTLVVTGELH